jgi:hypothetical protein
MSRSLLEEYEGLEGEPDEPEADDHVHGALITPRARNGVWSESFLNDMAEGRLPDAEVCRKYGVAWLDWLHIRTTPQWKAALAESQYQTKLKKLTFREKCVEIRDAYLPIMAELMSDSDVSPAVRVDAFKVVASGADDGSSKRPEMPTFNLQINYNGERPQDATVTIINPDDDRPLTIEDLT